MTRCSNNLEIKEESSWLVIFCLQTLLAASKGKYTFHYFDFKLFLNGLSLHILLFGNYRLSYCLAIIDAVHELRLAAECIQLLTVILRCHPQLLKKYA